MDFTKIKRTSEGRYEFAWRIPAERDERESVLRSFDEPLPEFSDAMGALVPHVIKLLELPDEYGKTLTVAGVSISYSKGEDRRGVVVTCLKSIAGANAPLVLNTPYLPAMDGDDPNPCLPGEFDEAIRVLEVQAQRYVDGERQQRDLFAGPKAA